MVSKGLNERAMELVDDLVSNFREYRVELTKTTIGALIIDCGVNTIGSLELGILVSEIAMAGLGKVTVTVERYGSVVLPTVHVHTDHPLEACILSQLAGWKISYGNFYAIGSGPARALARKPKKLYDMYGYEEKSDVAVLLLESSTLPPNEVLENVAKSCGVKTSNLYVLVVPSTSIAGSVQISARIVETGLFRFMYLGLDLRKVLSGVGRCPVAPPHPDPNVMLGRGNDMLIYGGETWYLIKGVPDQELMNLTKQSVSSTSKQFGKLMYDVFKEVSFDFYKVDPSLFAPASVTTINVDSGRVFQAGTVRDDMIVKSITFTPTS